MIVNVFDERAPGKHEAAPLEKGLDVVVVKIKKNMTMEQVVSEIKKEVEAGGGGPGSISLLRFFGHGNAGMMDFGKAFQYWTVEPFKGLAHYMDPKGKGLELHGCYTGSAVRVPGQDCSKPGKFYPLNPQPGKVGMGFELLLALSQVLKVPVTGGVNCQYGDSAHKLEGPTITVSPDGITMRNVPIDKYDDRGQPPRKAEPSQPESQVDLRPDLSERIKILEDFNFNEESQAEWQNQQVSILPDLSKRIKILEDFDESRGVDLQNRQASVVPDLSERIKILPDPDEQPEVDWQPFSDQIPSERFGADRLTDFQEEQKSFQPFSGETFRDKVDVARLTDFQEKQESFQPFSDQNVSERFGANRLRDFQEEPEPFQRFTNQNPMERSGADRLTNFPGHQEPFHRFTNQSPSERFGADRLTNFPGQEPFQPFANQPQWMKQGFGGPPQIGSQVDLRPQQPFADKPQWKK